MLACGLLTVWVASLGAAAIARRHAEWLRRSSTSSAALGLAPLALGAVAALSIISPISLVTGCHCLSHGHHLHLCFDHLEFSWLVACALPVACWALWAGGRRTLDVVRDIVVTARWARSLGVVGCDAPGVGLASGLGAAAATVGLARPKILMGVSLWDRLDDAERTAVVAHEAAHVARRDPLTLACVQLAACWMPRAAGRTLLGGWRRAAELACDDIAAVEGGDRLALASALVTCGRVQADSVLPGGLMTASGDPDDLDLRVRRLVDDESPTSRHRGSDLTRATFGLMAFVAIVTLFAGTTAHHAAETVLGWIS
jgi:hypothetical protein